MEHEVFVPVPADRLRAALADPAQVARAIPGLQQDAGEKDAGRVAGRLKLRIGSHSVTYRGTLRLSVRNDGSYAVEADGTESRGTGSVRLALTLRLREDGTGTTLACDGTAEADGRITELPAEQVTAAVTRLLNRFAEHLADAEAREPEQRPASVFDTEVPPPSLDPAADDAEDTGTGTGATGGAPDGADSPDGVDGVDDAEGAEARRDTGVSQDFSEFPQPPAEAAHARRTMIGRSAEEVDHAPPRGRYAPVPAAQTAAAPSPLRWAAPAAALVLASAIVLGRALRRRR
jgi:carbon monoxide dehydrogenase subunit G